MPRTATSTYDVIIVGYGPVGATFANLLARYGIKIAVVEQAAEVYDKPRAITMDHEVMRILQACGLTGYIETRTAPHNGTHFIGVDGDIIKVFDPMPPPYPLGWIPTGTFVQPELETALRDKLKPYDRADVFLAAKAVAVAQDDEGVSLTVVGEADGRERVLTARYLVACDGANSFVRRKLGIALADLAFDEWWMVVDALTSDVGKRPIKSFQYCRPSRPGTYVPGPRYLRRWEIKLLPGEDPADFGAPDNVRKLMSAFTDISDLQIWRTAVYRFHALLAEQWRVGRILLMGDAVHQTPPFLGQGLCAGIRYAFNPAGKLDRVLRGYSDADLLDTYATERRPHVRSIVAAAKEFGLIIGELDVAAAKARDQRLLADLKAGKAETNRQKFIPDLAGGLIATGAKLAGSLFVQPRVMGRAGKAVRADDLVSPGFLVVAASSGIFNDLSQHARRALDAIAAQRVVIAAESDTQARSDTLVLVETEGQFSTWLQEQGAEAVVVRPDRYVYGAAATGAELESLIERLSRDLRLQTRQPAAARA